jgi:hypothetical protein
MDGRHGIVAHRCYARWLKAYVKAAVEAAVQVAERWVLAPLRKRRFFSLGEANAAIAEQLRIVNNRRLADHRDRDGGGTMGHDERFPGQAAETGDAPMTCIYFGIG